MQSRRPEELAYPAGTIVANRLRIVRVIGVGGMGTVYEVEHELTKHHRALKVLHAKAAQQPSVVERFVREASAAGRIANAHIAETFDAGRLESGEPYLLMELIEGQTLDERLRQGGPIDVGELTDLVHQACEGVHAAHVSGIVHRDLKPENLIVTARDGAPFVKILDFGISKFDSERTGALGITTEGLVMGTPYYMSPEQLVASPTLDARTDVYSLGVILYECACGVRPYDAQSIEHLAILIHKGNAAPLASRRPDLPPALCAAVHRAMDVDRDARFQSARELAEAIAPLRSPAATMRAVSWSVPPARVVIHSSSPPARGSSAPPVAPAATTASGIAMGLAETTASGASAPPPPLPSIWRAIALAGALAAAAAVTGAFLWSSSRTGASDVASPVRNSAPPIPSLLQGAAPSIAPTQEALTAAGAADASLPQPTSAQPPSSSSRPVHGPPTNASGTAPAPLPSVSATPASKSRVDQHGLAGENPFR